MPSFHRHIPVVHPHPNERFLFVVCVGLSKFTKSLYWVWWGINLSIHMILGVQHVLRFVLRAPITIVLYILTSRCGLAGFSWSRITCITLLKYSFHVMNLTPQKITVYNVTCMRSLIFFFVNPLAVLYDMACLSCCSGDNVAPGSIPPPPCTSCAVHSRKPWTPLVPPTGYAFPRPSRCCPSIYLPRKGFKFPLSAPCWPSRPPPTSG